MLREDCMLIDNPEYPRGMISEMNAVISKFLDDIDFDNLTPLKQQEAFNIIMYSTHLVSKKRVN